MASVQVRILRSGRTDAYGLPLVPGSVATVERSYAVGLVYSGFASWMNPADAFDGETNIRKPSETYTLYQSGIPFWIPPGDAGANGLSFTGTRGVFTLSAAVVTNFWTFFASGGYCYLPAGAGGLATGGWYWCVMTSDTAGEVFANTHSGTGQPQFVASPTTLPNLSAGRITQTTSDVIVTSFTMPGNSQGPNGSAKFSCLRFGDTSATGKALRVSVGGTPIVNTTNTTIPVGESVFLSRNLGVSNRQANSRSLGVGVYGSTVATHQYTAINTAVDNTVSVIMAVSANTASHMICGCDFSVNYGA